MIEFLADFFFPLEAVEKNRVRFHFFVGNFDRDFAVIAQIDAAKNGSHAASGGYAVDAVVIEFIAGLESTHGEKRPAILPDCGANPRQYSL
jgi:hypothetical protein